MTGTDWKRDLEELLANSTTTRDYATRIHKSPRRVRQMVTAGELISVAVAPRLTLVFAPEEPEDIA